MDQEDKKYLCHDCIGDQYLSNVVYKEGETHTCTYCDEEDKCFELARVSSLFDRVIEEQFSITSNEPDGYEWAMMREFGKEWERAGEPIADVLQHIGSIDEDVALDIRELLHIEHDSMAPGDVHEEGRYEEDTHYELSAPTGYDFNELWKAVQDEVTSRARFFGPTAYKNLEELFQNIDTLATHDGTKVITTWDPETETHALFRARVCESDEDVETVLKNPVAELGAPPSKAATKGRMNAEGIPCFYGAENAETCISEIRPPVGSQVVLGEFKVTRPLKLLDFDLLTKVYVEGSFFDPDYASNKERAFFFRHLVSQLTKPVMPGEEAFEYLPTQYMAEFLAEKATPQLDGIIFHSAQKGGTNNNVVLFNKASKTETYDLPKGTDVKVHFDMGHPEDGRDEIWIFEETPSAEEKVKKRPRGPFGMFDGMEDFYDRIPDLREPTLKLDIERIKVLLISAVHYDTGERYLSRSRTERRAGPTDL